MNLEPLPFDLRLTLAHDWLLLRWERTGEPPFLAAINDAAVRWAINPGEVDSDVLDLFDALLQTITESEGL
jgi:hypothetical protein